MRVAEVVVRILPSGQYLVVFLFARGVDTVLLVGIPLVFGISYIVHAWAIGLAADCLIEFFGHKRYTFKSSQTGGFFTTVSQFMGYVSGRYFFASIGASIAWFVADGVIGPAMASLYVSLSIALWLVQVQVVRFIFRAKTYYRLTRMKLNRQWS